MIAAGGRLAFLQRLLPRSIRIQTLLISTGPAVTITVLLGFYLIHSQMQDLEAELEQTGQLIASQMAPAAEFGVLSGNRPLLANLLQSSLQRVPSLYSIRIRDSQGETLAYASRAPREQNQQQSDDLTGPFFASISREQVILDDHFLGSEQQAVQPPRLGMVEVLMTRDSLYARQRQIMLNAAAFSLIALLVTGLIAGALARSLSQPIGRMGLALRRIGMGDYQAHLAEQGPGEIGELARHINQLAGALARAEVQRQQHIEDLTTARVEAEKANQAKSSFLAMMSHELRTPLNGVFGMLQLLDTTRQTAEQSEYTQLAMESTDHLLNVINDILDLSRIERGLLRLEQVSFQPYELIERTVRAFRPSADKKMLSLTLSQPAELASLQVSGDATRLRQILVNLLGNAIKFTTHGSVEVEVSIPERTDEHLLLRCQVRDTGIGIDPGELTRMFVAFEQADTSTSRSYGGTGLGLTIASDLATRMGGRLGASSQPEQGSVFTLEIPLPWQPLEAGEPSHASSTVSSTGRHLLLVEDDPVNRYVIESLLRHLGHEVDHAADGAQALEMAARQHYDALLLDCQLPIVDGLEVTRRIRAGDGPNRHTPIIALTANVQRSYRQQCLDAGMNDYLSKPARLTEVQSALDCWLQTRP